MSAAARDVLLYASIPFGLVLGSFLNVCIFRVPRECMSIAGPRSRCMSCLRTIRWFENIPVFSYLFLGGRCAGCGARISLRYPLVELLTAALVLLVVWRRLYGEPPPPLDFPLVVLTLAHVYVAAQLVVATWIDFDFRILPNEITYSGIAAGLVAGAAFPILHRTFEPEIFEALSFSAHFAGLTAAALGAVVGAGIILFVRVAGSWIFRKEAMGQGDIFYLAFIGAFLGWRGAAMTFVLACIFGAVYGVGHLLITRDRYLAFGPFLSLGALVMMLFDGAVWGVLAWYQSLFAFAG